MDASNALTTMPSPVASSARLMPLTANRAALAVAATCIPERS